MINYRGIELDRTAYDRDIPKVATMLKDGGGVLISTCPTREAVKRGWVCALLPPVNWGGLPRGVGQVCSFAYPNIVLGSRAVGESG